MRKPADRPMTAARLPIAGVILAGGRSRRMGGGDKCLAELGGRSLLDHVIARIAPQVSDLALNANGDPSRFAAFELPVVADSVGGQPGPLAGILAGLDWAAARGAARVVTVAADTPFFPADLASRLADETDPDRIGLAESAGGGIHPVFGIWPVGLRARLRADLMGGTRKVRLWAETQGCDVIPFAASDGQDPFFNINTPEDLATARDRIVRQPEGG